MSSSWKGAFWFCGGILIIALAFAFAGTPIGLVIFGWIGFLQRVMPQIQVSWKLVASGVVYWVLLVVGLHLFLRWLSRSWPLRRTLGIVCLIVVMFASGLAFTGILRQAAWLFS